MGGTLVLQDGSLIPNRKNTCLSSYRRDHDNFALSNFDDNDGNGYEFIDPDMGKIWFPTSEHYLHFQKLTPQAKKNNLAAWQNEKRPGVILEGIRNAKSPYFIETEDYAFLKNGKFDSSAWDEHKVYVQIQINISKYQQSNEFKESIKNAIDVGEEFGDNDGPCVIIEDTSSARRVEKEWGTGPDGMGRNLLGITQTATASLVQNNQIRLDQLPTLQSVTQSNTVTTYYKKAEAQYELFKPTLQNIREQANCHAPKPGQTDTSDLGQNFVAHYNKPNVSASNTSYFYSKGGNQRLIIEGGKIIGYQYRNNNNWIDTQYNKRIAPLVAFYNRENPPIKTTQHSCHNNWSFFSKKDNTRKKTDTYKNAIQALREPSYSDFKYEDKFFQDQIVLSMNGNQEISKKIDIPECIRQRPDGTEPSYTIQEVTGAFQYKDNIVLAFSNDISLNTAYESLDNGGALAKVIPVVTEGDNRQAMLMVLGGEKALEVAVPIIDSAVLEEERNNLFY